MNGQTCIGVSNPSAILISGWQFFGSPWNPAVTVRRCCQSAVVPGYNINSSCLFSLHNFPFSFFPEEDRCKLYCTAEDFDFFFAMSNRVRDGTPCSPYRDDVCIDGICEVRSHLKFSPLQCLWYTSTVHWVLCLSAIHCHICFKGLEGWGDPYLECWRVTNKWPRQECHIGTNLFR